MAEDPEKPWWRRNLGPIVLALMGLVILFERWAGTNPGAF